MGHENFESMRKAMLLSQLRPSDVNDPKIIAAIGRVQREDFVPASLRNIAYADRGVHIGQGRYLNPPITTGRFLEAANLTADDDLLIIGAGTGYLAAVAAQLAGQITAVEESSKLCNAAKQNLDGIANIKVEKAKLAVGISARKPYSAIIIDGAVEHIPESITDLLGENGRLVCAMLDQSVTRLAIGHKINGSIGYNYFADCGCAALPGFQEKRSFEF